MSEETVTLPQWPILYAILRPALFSGNDAVRHHMERLAEVLDGEQRTALRELLDRPASTMKPARVIASGVSVLDVHTKCSAHPDGSI